VADFAGAIPIGAGNAIAVNLVSIRCGFFRQEKFMDWSNVIDEITEAIPERGIKIAA
jgi:hypothetical protein